MRQGGTDAEPTRSEVIARVGSAQYVRVVVTTTALSHGGHTYSYDDEMVLPREHVESWLASGYVRLFERSRDANGMRDGRVHSDEFTNNGR